MRRVSIFATSTLLLIGVIIVSGLMQGYVMAANSQASKLSFPPLGPYRMHGKLPPGFEDFCGFTLRLRPGETQVSARPNKNGELTIDGWVQIGIPLEVESSDQVASESDLCKDGIRYALNTAVLKQESQRFAQITFTTVTIEGVYYEFRGRFFEKSKRVDDMYVDLEGCLTKFKDEKPISQTTRQFVNWTYE
jgi:hypothetical protein